MEQFLRDHGTGALPEHYYDQYVQDSIDRLRQARRVGRRRGLRRRRVPQDPGIALIGTLDTKGAEIAYVRDRLRALGARPVVIDSGILGEPTAASPTSARGGRRARRATTSTAIRAAGSRGAAVAADARRACARSCCALYAEGRVHGVLCLGGAEGALLGAAAMHALPVGVPKLIVSPSASGRRAFGPFMGEGDMTVMHSVVDILGLQRDLARDLRQRGRRDRGHGARRRAARSASSASACVGDHDARPDDAGRDAACASAARRPATSR